MDIDDFQQVITGDEEIDSLLRECIETLATKGAEYADSKVDRLENFRSVGEEVDVPMEKVWYTFFNKQYRAIRAYIKNGRKVKSKEPIRGRIMDCIVYLLLFHKMTLEFERDDKLRKTLAPNNGIG